MIEIARVFQTPAAWLLDQTSDPLASGSASLLQSFEGEPATRDRLITVIDGFPISCSTWRELDGSSAGFSPTQC
ncbi:hypothetical protein [Candidatus Viadribacter manganicus]|uniref:Uncharacterized protein n=1 Tax=Candidatus Viadribacter manganicus TaxID=1759059 RepID=A0A1B1AIZ1_9PROT|nr:hypothetical protein [Candidatus Viadribacter manganicus]ANP46521.1 hypothetical protein ATE48_11625 [Candidatus Viadribacter manganicus]